MRLIPIWLWVAVASWSLGIGTAQAQSTGATAETPVALVVRAKSRDAARCFEVNALRERIARYRGAHAAKAVELRLELYVDDLNTDTAELRVFRGDVLVSRRRFEHLPMPCANRRDTVALSIALALEGAMQQLTAADTNAASGTPPTPARAEPPPNDAGANGSVAKEPEGAGASQPSETTRPLVRAESETPRQPESAETAAAPERESSPSNDANGQSDSSDEDEDDEVAPAATSGIGIAAHAGGRWLAEALPSPVWTGVLGVELQLNPQIAVDLSAFASTVANSDLAGARAQTSLLGGELFGCAAWKLGGFAAQGCLGATSAACDARGRDFAVARPAATLLWAAGAARLGLRWPDNRLISLRLVLQLNVNLVRPDLHVDGSSEQLSPGWVGGAAGLDVILALE